FTLAPAPGYAMTVTNLEFQAFYVNHLYQEPGATGAVVFVRSSLDNFTANLTNWVLLPDNWTFPTTWQTYSLDLGSSFANLLGNVDFRIYFYDNTYSNQVGVRLDNLYLKASTLASSTAQQVTLVGTITNAAEPATPAQFTISRAGDTANPLTVYYNVSGTASNGVDYAFLPGSVTIPAGQSSVQIAVTPIDDELPESTETVVLSLTPNSNYGVLSPSTATAFLADDGDIGGLIAWFFNESNNGAGSLSAVAAPAIRLTNKVVGLNAAAGPGLGLLGANGGTGVGHGYGTSIYRSAPSTVYINGGYVGTNAADALNGGDYISLTISPVAGNTLTLTNFSAWMALAPGTNQTAYAFLRSSLDNFASDLGSFIIPGNSNTTTSAFVPWNLPLAMPNNAGPVEFRVYVYCSRTLSADIIRLDDVILQGSVGNLPAGAQAVTVAASTPNAAEPNTPGAFTLTRFGDTTAALTVNYAIGGTASNGVDYATLNGTATFGAGATSLVIPVTVLDDNRPEPTETVILTLQPTASYSPGWPSTATVNIADNNDTTPVITLSATDTNAFERVSNLLAAFTFSRSLGDTNIPVTVNFTLGGTATLGVDYVSSATNSLTLGAGVTNASVFIYPIDNALVDGDRTVTLSAQSGSGFIFDPPTGATVTIFDDETPTATVLWSDNFDAGTSGANYTIKAASVTGIDDYVADFAFDYSSLGVPPAPHSGNTTIGLMLNANQFGGAAGVNLYPNGQSFSGDFALRFDLFLSMDPGGSPDNEGVLFGINQSGTVTNWLSASTGTAIYTNSGEGIFACIATRDGVPNVYNLFASTNGSTSALLVANQGNVAQLFNSPPYATAGRVNNTYDSTNKAWVDCELSQVAGVVTLKLNNNVVLRYTNTFAATAGNIFLGYDDP
ncbi:MAG TPA: Calx-beta domain-containing protein, partial [Bacillota bacterium]|nr:Calx-beta domain-containing protein [Bacillota bacterium]